MSSIITVEKMREILTAPHIDSGAIEKQLASVVSLIRAATDGSWFVIEDGQSGIATFIEVLIGKPNQAVSFRKSLLGPYAAFGGASYRLAVNGQLTAWSEQTLMSVDNFDNSFDLMVKTIKEEVKQLEWQIISKAELNITVPVAISSLMQTSLPSIEGRLSKVLYDVIFQWHN